MDKHASDEATQGPQTTPDKAPQGSVLSRWSRRKAEVAAGTSVQSPTSDGMATTGSLTDQAEGPLVTEPAAASTVTNEVEASEEEPLLCDEDMPAIETLDSSSDLSCFFNRGVSEKLRQAALHHLLRLPAFNIRDGLNDYDEDYTVFEPLGDTVTCDMRFQAERKARLAEEEEAARQAELQQDNPELAEPEPGHAETDKPAAAEQEQVRADAQDDVSGEQDDMQSAPEQGGTDDEVVQARITGSAHNSGEEPDDTQAETPDLT